MIFTYHICIEYAQCNYLILSINIEPICNRSFNRINISLMSCNMKWCHLHLLRKYYMNVQVPRSVITMGRDMRSFKYLFTIYILSTKRWGVFTYEIPIHVATCIVYHLPHAHLCYCSNANLSMYILNATCFQHSTCKNVEF